MRLSIVFVLAVVIPANYHYSEALKCYVCQSNVDPKCADPFDNLTLPITDCNNYPRADLAIKSPMDLLEGKSLFQFFGQSPQIEPLKATVCRKTRQKVDGEWRTIRGCGYLTGSENDPTSTVRNSAQNECKMKHGTHDIFVESCTCNTKDGCNSATGLFSHELHGNVLLRWTIISLVCIIVTIKSAN